MITVGMADELRKQQAQQQASAAMQLTKGQENAEIFAASMDRLAPEYAKAAIEFGIEPSKSNVKAGAFKHHHGWKPLFSRGSISREPIWNDIPKRKKHA
jgi:hypothetical protein